MRYCVGMDERDQESMSDHLKALVASAYNKRSQKQDPLLENPADACPSCGYELGGLKFPGICPECGLAYTRASVERWIREEMQWRSTRWLRTLVALFALDVVASFLGAWASERWVSTELDSAILLTLLKVFLLDGLLLFCLLVLMLLSRKFRPSRVALMSKCALRAGVVGAVLTILGGILGSQDVRMYILPFAMCVGIGTVIGWVLALVQPLVHDP